MSEELTRKSASELVQLIRSRSVSAIEVVEAHLRRIDEVNPLINAIVTVAPDVMKSARAADDALAKGEEFGPLHGLPITIKDTIDTKGIRTTSGSRRHANRIPDHDASVVATLKAAGAIVLGKTNVPEMAIPYETDNPVFGRTDNPGKLVMTPGGSSGGEAAAIAAYLSPAGVGSDLSGSIRVPAHFCGIAGLKPTTGRIAFDGHVPEVVGPLAVGASFGPMARCVDDLALLFGVMAATGMPFDDASDRSLRPPVAFYTYDGIAPVTEETEATVRTAAKILSDAGFTVREERPPGVSEGSRLWIELFSHASSQQVREFYRGRESEAGPLVASMLGKKHDPPSFEDRVETAERLSKAIVERERLREILLRWMKDTPLIIAPVGAFPAFGHGTRRVDVHGDSISIFRAFSYCQTFNVFGLPAIALPVGRSSEGLPLGVQIVGRPFAESEVLRAARIIESTLSLRA